MDLKNIHSEEIYRLWEKGKTLGDSIFEYSDSSLLENYRKHHTKSTNSSLSQDKNAQSGRPISAVIFELQKTVSNITESQNLRDKLRRDILNKIITKKLVGIGYEYPITVSDLPIIIPPHIWPDIITEINWDNSSFLFKENEFLKIRIINCAKINNPKIVPIEKPKSLPDIEVKDKDVGRPSIKFMIEKAYEDLKKQNKINFSKALKSHTELIQETVRILYSEKTDNIGMQHETIRRTIGERFKADKKTSKSTLKL